MQDRQDCREIDNAIPTETALEVETTGGTGDIGILYVRLADMGREAFRGPDRVFAALLPVGSVEDGAGHIFAHGLDQPQDLERGDLVMRLHVHMRAMGPKRRGKALHHLFHRCQLVGPVDVGAEAVIGQTARIPMA